MPLLQDGQDPDGLAARVAYHLHRHGIAIKQLNHAGITFDTARQLRKGAIQMDAAYVSQLASALRLDAEELSRALEDSERMEWEFYRTSARHATIVWKRVFESSTAHSVSQRHLSTLLNIPQSHLSLLATGKTEKPALTFPQAETLAKRFGFEEGANAFISGLSSEVREHDRE